METAVDILPASGCLPDAVHYRFPSKAVHLFRAKYPGWTLKGAGRGWIRRRRWSVAESDLYHSEVWANSGLASSDPSESFGNGGAPVTRSYSRESPSFSQR